MRPLAYLSRLAHARGRTEAESLSGSLRLPAREVNEEVRAHIRDADWSAMTSDWESVFDFQSGCRIAQART